MHGIEKIEKLFKERGIDFVRPDGGLPPTMYFDQLISNLANFLEAIHRDYPPKKHEK